MKVSDVSSKVSNNRKGGEMATMKAVLETVNGLYRDPDTGRGYGPGELMSFLPNEALRSRVRMRRSGMGVYVINLDDGRAFDLYSRRRKRRMSDR